MIRLLSILLLITAAACHAQSSGQIKVSQLPATGNATDADSTLILQGGTTKRATIAAIRAITGNHITDSSSTGRSLLTGNVTTARALLGITDPVWGSITGNISAQSDLATALSLKADASALTSVTVNATRITDSTSTGRSLLTGNVTTARALLGITDPVWGSITGNLSAQSDLASALSLKANAADVVALTGDQEISGNKTFTNLSLPTAGTLDAGFGTLNNVGVILLNAFPGEGIWDLMLTQGDLGLTVARSAAGAGLFARQIRLATPPNSGVSTLVFPDGDVSFTFPAASGNLVLSSSNATLTGHTLLPGTLRAPSSAPASPAAGDLYRNANTLRYRDSTNTERLLLNATDNLANLGNATTARTNLGLGSSATLNVGTSAGTVAAGDDSRFTSSTAHADLRPATSLRLPSAAPGSPGSGDIYRVTDTVRYRDSSNTERLLLNATDNLANLGNATTARTNLGLPTLSTDGNNTLTITGPSLTGNQSASALAINQTWNTTGTPTALDVNVTDTASNASSLLARLRVAGFTMASIAKDGGATFGLTQSSSGWAYIGPSGASFWRDNNNIGEIELRRTEGIRLGQGKQIAWRDGSIGGGNVMDLVLLRDASDTLAQRRSTNAQTFRLYGTYTDASNYRRLAVSSTTAGAFTLTAEGAGTGASGNILRLTSPVLAPAASATPTVNGDLTFEATSNTQLTIRYRGSDGTVRSANLTLTP